MTEASTASPEQPGLFPGTEVERVTPAPDSISVPSTRMAAAIDEDAGERAARTRNSMLWAAYGDALGFISELVDRKGLERRTRGAPLDHLMEWRRRVGGRSGVDVLLPAGCWSDDTQLRMAVGRSLGCHGFDVETFARVELPVWLSYALGGGRASKAAARNLGKQRTLWYANTFRGWANAGGNGAAMRIQPHVWASHDLVDDYLLDVITDSVCTHGHPRAIVGACFHAATLAYCLGTGTVPDSRTCADIARNIGDVLPLIEDHGTLGATWIGLWQQETGNEFRDVWRLTARELCVAINDAVGRADDTEGVEAAYAAIVARLGLENEEQQGSGILTTVAAVALAAAASKAHEGVLTAANATGTDTDTIATMTGALLGACDGAASPPEEPLDSDYLRAEADRLVAVSRGEQADNYTYPDLLTWSAPETQADALVSDNGGLAVEGLGPAKRLAADAIYTARRDFAWEWVRTDFGQTLLIKRRPEVKPLEAGNNLTPPPTPRGRSNRQAAKPGRRTSNRRALKPLDRGVKVDDAIEYAREQITDDTALGYTVRRVARDGTIADLAALVTALRDDLRH
ncbi:MAG: hypothetical protein F4126_00960 [Acidimicrobiaceae bacterium]|nr:hypothetical protein [Acidimicrobiaceae bacterium]MXZ52941.1 hypothetical protein [Acidimicrobiaceae bacterium]MYB88099.1 hypothetical protein [Acidimicrobiaceae bacterium]MYH92263.1 hypothetical protein [Acidimicrobiaceae bacterium]